jgi:hypothetical protein
VYGSEIERLADHVEAHLDMARLDAIVGLARHIREGPASWPAR